MNKRLHYFWLIPIALLLVMTGSYKYVDFDDDGANEINGDCKPFNEDIGPNSIEVSFDGIDQNCDGEDFVEDDTADNDSDDYSKLAGDCNDADASINPKAVEIVDGKDNNCDKHTDEQELTFELIKNPITSSIGTGLDGIAFLKAIGANAIASSGSIYDGRLQIIATTKSAIPTEPSFKSVGIKLYLIEGSKSVYQIFDQRFLDAAWVGNGRSNLNTDTAGENGGIFFAGQVRTLDLNLRALPVSAKSLDNSKRDIIDLLSLINDFQERGLMMGFSTSAPNFGVIRSATLILKVEGNTKASAVPVR